MARLSRALPSLVLCSLLLALPAGCGGSGECTLIGCESTLVVDYGVVVNEPYTLVINPGGPNVSVECLTTDPDAEPPPEWLTCTASGFEITGEQAEITTISVTVVPLSTGEAVVPNALVTLTVEQVLEPNGPDCGPVCYRRVGQVPPTGGLP
jgi:hypothetical protein